MHKGTSLDYGHYYAYRKRDDTWLLADDCKVQEVKEGAVLSSAPYMAFYQTL